MYIIVFWGLVRAVIGGGFLRSELLSYRMYVDSIRLHSPHCPSERLYQAILAVEVSVPLP